MDRKRKRLWILLGLITVTLIALPTTVMAQNETANAKADDLLQLVVEFSEARVTEFSQRLAGHHNLLVGVVLGALIALPHLRRRRFLTFVFVSLCLTSVLYLYARMGYWSALTEGAPGFLKDVRKEDILPKHLDDETTIVYAKVYANISKKFWNNTREKFKDETWDRRVFLMRLITVNKVDGKTRPIFVAVSLSIVLGFIFGTMICILLFITESCQVRICEKLFHPWVFNHSGNIVVLLILLIIAILVIILAAVRWA